MVATSPDAKRLYDNLLRKSGYNKLIRPVGNNTDILLVNLGLRLTQIIDVVSGADGACVSPLASSSRSDGDTLFPAGGVRRICGRKVCVGNYICTCDYVMLDLCAAMKHP